jgi:branched-chain amino acid transport system permease protein
MFSKIRRRFAELTEPLREQLRNTTLLAYQVGLLAAILLESAVGQDFAKTLNFRKIPKFFGIVDIFEPFSDLDFSGILAPFFPSPSMVVESPLKDSGQAIGELISTFWKALFYQGRRDPGFFDVVLRVAIYDIVVFVIPTILIALLLRVVVARFLKGIPRWVGLGIYLIALYAIVMLWGADGGSRELILIFMGINIMLSASLNLVNGYMGEFSVGHAGFMAVGAYVSSILTMWLFIDDRVFGEAVLSSDLGLPIGFIVALLAGGVAAALAGLMVAFPSFKTRGDYLAIVTLAVNFIVQGVINNIESIGGARGLNGVPLWTNLNWIFVFTILSLAAIYNLVNSTLGKGIIAIREDEISASLMGVNTRHLKLVAFLVSSFIAGVAGGLFAHQLAYVNPGNFGILKSTEALVMVYLGGMGSITGSVIAAAIFTILIEALRPLAVLKWVVIPLVLIILMLFRPQGLFGFREIKLNLGLRSNSLAGTTAERKASDVAASD